MYATSTGSIPKGWLSCRFSISRRRNWIHPRVVSKARLQPATMRQILLLIAITCDGKITYGNIAINNYLWQKPLLIAAVSNGHSHRRHTAQTDSALRGEDVE